MRVWAHALHRGRPAAVLIVAACASLGGCAHGAKLARSEALTPEARLEAIGRAHVWSPVDVAAADLRRGPRDDDAFAPNAWVDCAYKVQKDQSGRSPKFACGARDVPKIPRRAAR